LAHPEALRRFADVNDLPLTLDTAHAATWPYDVLETYTLFRDRLVNVHLSDLRPLPGWLDWPPLHSYIKHHQLPGAGVLPITELLDRMRYDGYHGLITLELSPIALKAWWPARARASLLSTVRFLSSVFSRPVSSQSP
jgi:sugar phosphate isomerase/epimerase